MQPHQSPPPPDHTAKFLTAAFIVALAVGCDQKEAPHESPKPDDLGIAELSKQVEKSLAEVEKELAKYPDPPDFDVTQRLSTLEWKAVSRNGFRIKLPGKPYATGNSSTGKFAMGGLDFTLEVSYAERPDAKTADQLRAAAAAKDIDLSDFTSSSEDGKSRTSGIAFKDDGWIAIGELRCIDSNISLDVVTSAADRAGAAALMDRVAVTLVCADAGAK